MSTMVGQTISHYRIIEKLNLTKIRTINFSGGANAAQSSRNRSVRINVHILSLSVVRA
jgi:hypothetical protein